MKKPKDFPFDEVAENCRKIVERGEFILQKWTCVGCGRRLNANRVNYFTEKGHCQHCNHVTDLVERGCNFALICPSFPCTAADVERSLGLTDTGIQ